MAVVVWTSHDRARKATHLSNTVIASALFVCGCDHASTFLLLFLPITVFPSGKSLMFSGKSLLPQVTVNGSEALIGLMIRL